MSRFEKWVGTSVGKLGALPGAHGAGEHAGECRPAAAGLTCSSSPPPGRQLELVRAEIAETGDVGLVAENSRSTQRLMLPPPPLTAAGVLAKFRDIARLTGSAVSERGPRPGPQPCALRLGDMGVAG